LAQKIRIAQGYDHRVLDQAADKIVDTARVQTRALPPDPAPTEISKLTVIRSPFIDKDSREQFEMRTHSASSTSSTQPARRRRAHAPQLPAGVSIRSRVERPARQEARHDTTVQPDGTPPL